MYVYINMLAIQNMYISLSLLCTSALLGYDYSIIYEL